jgi:cell division protein FtsA
VIEAAKAVAVPLDRQVLHVIPREYKVDEQEGILDPRGMSGVRLEASVHIVTASHTAVTNNLKCIERAGLQSLGLVLDQLASSQAVLSEDEKKLGVVLVDMGADSCHLIYFIHGSVAKTSNIPVGGHHLTHDIAIGLRTPQIAAESLKRKYGSAMMSLVREDESIEVEGVGGRNSRMVRRRDLAEVIEPRVEEMLLMIQKDIELSGLKPLLGSGVVLTGGTSELRGLTEMAEFFFDLPVRKGNPDQIGGLREVVRSGDCATSVGLLLYAHQQKKYARAYSLQALDFSESAAKPIVSGVGNKIKKLWQDLF